MARNRKELDVGIFAQTLDNIEEFANNIYMAQYLQEVVEGHMRLEQEYHQAILADDPDAIAVKEAEMEVYSNSFALTYHLFDGAEILQ